MVWRAKYATPMGYEYRMVRAIRKEAAESLAKVRTPWGWNFIEIVE